MLHLCLLAITVVLCILIISLFNPQIMEPYESINVEDQPPDIVGAKGYVDKPWHTAGGATYYMDGGKNIKYHQDIIDYRGHSHDTKYVSDVLAGNDGLVPEIPQYKTDRKEHFWYDMNRLEDSGWHSGQLDSELTNMTSSEKKWRDDLYRAKLLKLSSMQKKGDDMENNNPPVEGFGNHRAPENWNESDYPMVTTNGIDMSNRFPQQGKLHKIDPVIYSRLWGELDTLKGK